MISQVTFNRDKWIAALMLDPITGLDPPGAKVRAAEGIDAASSFIQGYWLWYVATRACVYVYSARANIFTYLFLVCLQVQDRREPCGCQLRHQQPALGSVRLAVVVLQSRGKRRVLLEAPYNHRRLCVSALEALGACHGDGASCFIYRARENRKVVLTAHSMGSSVSVS